MCSISLLISFLACLWLNLRFEGWILDSGSIWIIQHFFLSYQAYYVCVKYRFIIRVVRIEIDISIVCFNFLRFMDFNDFWEIITFLFFIRLSPCFCPYLGFDPFYNFLLTKSRFMLLVGQKGVRSKSVVNIWLYR